MFDAEDALPIPLPPSTRQLNFARLIAARTGAVIPWETQQDRGRLTLWIDEHKADYEERQRAQVGGYGVSSKQVAFARSLARRRNRSIPEACYSSRSEMSRWIEANR